MFEQKDLNLLEAIEMSSVIGKVSNQKGTKTPVLCDGHPAIDGALFESGSEHCGNSRGTAAATGHDRQHRAIGTERRNQALNQHIQGRTGSEQRIQLSAVGQAKRPLRMDHSHLPWHLAYRIV